ncbi:RNA ligase family protein [Hymenobacter defluvii]|uniref:RNA ligase domain-containing protein n=1 Tax=Hymenobacter defluvii TaxID=2054411 RepID=A0ABS3TFD8_9BACT|nr:RNA ligase family protein [Hymenobacter defluvii]MBO3272349.1 hypothetical protein [Hymenobacter defluvii]
MSILFNSQARATATRSLSQLNTLTKYPSILTLHALGERGRLTTDFTTPGLFTQTLTATEKIDGTNARLLVFADGSYVVGSRENLLTVSGDLLFDPAVGIVDGLRRLVFPQFADEQGHLPSLVYQTAAGQPAPLTVLFGEFYGGKVTGSSKYYGPPTQVGFRVFDVVAFSDADALATQLQADIRDLSTWRETETPTGLRYGQPFLSETALTAYLAQVGLPAVPQLPAFTAEATHEQVLEWLRQHIPHTQAALSGQATPGRAEGAILRTADRSAIVKVRFEDYERTLNQRGK